MLLTETEVAGRLGCSQSKIKRLRAAGRLPFIPGRPVLIDETDLETYLAEERAKLPPTPGSTEHKALVAIKQSALARRLWTLRQVVAAQKAKKADGSVA